MRRLLFMFSPALVFAALAFGACSGGDGADDQRLEDLEARVSAVEARADSAGLVATIYLLDSSGFHDMDETINKEGRIEARYEGAVERARAAVLSTHWPEQLQGRANELLQALDELLPALQANDAAKAGPAATRVHTVEHNLSHDAWPLLAGEEHESSEGDHG